MGNWRSKHYEQDEFLQELLHSFSGTDEDIRKAIAVCKEATEDDWYLFCYLDNFIVHGAAPVLNLVLYWIATALALVPSTTLLASPQFIPLLIHLIKVATHYNDTEKQLLQRLVDYYAKHKDIYTPHIDCDLLHHVMSILRHPSDFTHFKGIIAQLPANNTLQNVLCELALEPYFRVLQAPKLNSSSSTRAYQPPSPHPVLDPAPSHPVSALPTTLNKSGPTIFTLYDAFDDIPDDKHVGSRSAATTICEKRVFKFNNLSGIAHHHSLNTSAPWHVNTLLLPSNHPDNYCIIEGRPEHYKQVNELYARNPVPGYTIKSVKIIHNEHLKKLFEGRINFLERRHDNAAFTPNWKSRCKTDEEYLQRKRTQEHFQKLARCDLYIKAPHVSLLPLWHGTSSSILESLFTTGYASLASTDSGFFGKGIYGTPDAEYAFRVYSKGALLINWVAVFSAFPVILQDEEELVAKGNFENYDAHFVPVYSPNHPQAKSYHACAPDEQHQYSELVVFESSQVLPHYIVELQQSSHPSPPNTPLPLVSPPESASEVLSLTEAAAYLSMTENKVLDLLKAHKLTGRKLESHWQITKEELDKYLRS